MALREAQPHDSLDPMVVLAVVVLSAIMAVGVTFAVLVLAAGSPT